MPSSITGIYFFQTIVINQNRAPKTAQAEQKAYHPSFRLLRRITKIATLIGKVNMTVPIASTGKKIQLGMSNISINNRVPNFVFLTFVSAARTGRVAAKARGLRQQAA